MGNNMCSNPICRGKQNIKREESFPMNAVFEPVTCEIEIKPQHERLLKNIKKQLPVIDPRTNNKLSWYQSTKYNLYFYGTLDKERPIGDCFFYSTKEDDEDTPIMVTTNINHLYVFSDKTLIINSDQTAYFGSIKNNIATLPRAQGQGILFSPDFIYEGDFKNGSPHGYGHYRSKTLECVGQFKNGQPWGECIQKNNSQIFIGTLISDRERVGFKITNKNKRIPVNFKKQESIKERETKDMDSKQPLQIEGKEPAKKESVPTPTAV